MIRQAESSGQTGGALIIVLLAVALISLLALSLSEHSQRSIKVAQNSQIHQQARWYARGAEQLFLKQYGGSAQGEQNAMTSSASALDVQHFDIDDGYITASVKDLRACFNINSLAEHVVERGGLGIESVPVQQLTVLAQQAGIEQSQVRQLVEQLYDWLDPDTIPAGTYGAEDLYYTARAKPYRTPNGAMANLSELYLTNSPVAVIKKIQPYLCALPLGAGGLLSINSVQHPELLIAAIKGLIGMQEATLIISSRPASGYASFAEMLQLFSEEKRNLLLEQLSALTLFSDYYRMDITVNHRGRDLRLSSFLRQGEAGAYIYQRQYGGGL